jgi:signal transduction histidine kinase
MIGRSLSGRLLVALLVAQIGAIMLAMLVFPLVAPFVNYDDIAEATFRSKIENAIARAPSGKLAIETNVDLKKYVDARPGAAFAVASLPDGKVLAGSDERLAQILEHIRPFAPRPAGNLITDDNLTGRSLIVTTQDTSFGRLMFATTGNAFHAEDWTNLFEAFSPVFLPVYGPVILGALVLIPLTVRLVTRPLRRLAADASLIDPGRLAIRLGEEGLGIELQSLARAINEALARIEQGISRQRLYAANAAHELRTPMAILSLRVDALPHSDQKSQLQVEIARLQTLVEQLVTVARLGQAHVAMDERVDLVQLLRDAVADRAPIAFRAGREIELETTPEACIVRGNRQALFSALANVIDNALRAEPPGGAIIVKLDGEGVVEIVDHGDGVAPCDRTMAFEPFWRGATTGAGAGLGLAIVKEIADRHGVEVEVADTQGGGATFRFAFEPDGF